MNEALATQMPTHNPLGGAIHLSVSQHSYEILESLDVGQNDEPKLKGIENQKNINDRTF